MTRVNLLRPTPERRRYADSPIGRWRRLTACSAVLALTSSGVTCWWWTVRREAARVEADLLRARHELARLRTASTRSDALTRASRDLQQSVDVLEALGAAQRTPPGIFDAIGSAMPRDCWLISIAYETSGAVRVEGRAHELASLLEFEERLEGSGAFAGGIHVVESHADTSAAAGPVVAFSLEARAGVQPDARGTAAAATHRPPPVDR